MKIRPSLAYGIINTRLESYTENRMGLAGRVTDTSYNKEMGFAIQAAEILVKAGFDVNRVDKRGVLYTPLRYAVISGYPELVRFFIQRGAGTEDLVDVAESLRDEYSAYPIRRVAEKYGEIAGMLRNPDEVRQQAYTWTKMFRDNSPGQGGGGRGP